MKASAKYAWVVALGVALAAVLVAPAALAAAEYVVSQKHPEADDAKAGTALEPFKTIGKGASVAKAGDTVFVKAGTYAEKVTLKTSGTAARPITLRAAPGERVVIGGPGQRRGSITWGAGVGYLVIDGFQVIGDKGASNRVGIGSSGKGGHHVTVQNCVLIGTSIRLSGQADCVVRRSIQTGVKGNGVSLSGATRCTVEECEIFGNRADGLVVAGGSDGCKVLRNYIHNQWYADHPDGLQIYRTVTNLHVEGNLLFNSGQGFMMEETTGGVFRNNIICGTHQSGILLGHQNTHDWDLDGNTIAYTGFKAIGLSGRGTRIRNNVLLTGGDNMLIIGGEWPWTSDYNLLWKAEDSVKHHVREGGEAHSKVADPKFRSAPPLGSRAIFYVDHWVDEQAPAKCTPGKLCIGRKGMAKHFKVGDHVEVNFDGVVRKVTGVTDDSVLFEPPLAKLHQLVWDVIVNWKDAEEFVWDLRLADDSPGKGMGEGGRDVGSSIDMQAYMRGDFNGDGRRDLPEMPPAPKVRPDWSD